MKRRWKGRGEGEGRIEGEGREEEKGRGDLKMNGGTGEKAAEHGI